ncbi:hypothetical protein [Mycoplasma todarodis]|uniref:glycoside hydrolase family 38 N-terminal domain-containing protein n=1 Tax=Mycoplasma todarodis TaxID=1937191 RepID=UPI003B2BCF20
MKTILIVPHTHWDREWYFTNNTSNILLQRLGQDLKNRPISHFTLDGQSSLTDDLITNNPSLKNDLEKLIADGKLVSGPLYVQQDTMNTMVATTQYNIELGKRYSRSKTINKTVYMPDSFGFNEQLPQIWKKNGFENFVFWRGIKPDDFQKTNLFNWKGIDGTTIKTSCLKNGYYTLGQHYPYVEDEKRRQTFKEQLIIQAKELAEKSKQNIYLLPLGGDQAPLEYAIDEIVKEINAEQSEWKFKVGTYEQYFETLDVEPTEEIKYPLYYSGTSKIHRTIHSNRYDIKNLFRKCELSFNYILKPLEVIYERMGGKLLSEEIIDNEILKPLLKSSAHDSLGGCNSDKTNSVVLNRLIQVKEFQDSYIDLMMRDIKENFAKENQYIIVNTSPFTRNVVIKDIISTRNNKKLNIKQTNTKMITESIEDISWEYHEPVFKHNVIINALEMKPFSMRIVDIQEAGEEPAERFEKSIAIDGEKINLNFKGNKKEIAFHVEYEDGDEFDQSTPIESKAKTHAKQTHNIVEAKYSNGIETYKIETEIEYGDSKFIINSTIKKINDNFYHDIQIENNLRNVKVSLALPKEKLILSRHLAFIEQQMDNIPNWKENYRDNPVNSYANDGLVKNGELSIFTKGTNLVTSLKDRNEIVLFRSVDMLGKPELEDRPGVASGLPQKVNTPDALLIKKLNFELAYSMDNSIKGLNNWYFDGLGYFTSHTDKTLKKVDNFVINTVQLKEFKDISIEMDINTELVGLVRKTEKQNIQIIKSNPTDNEVDGYKGYEIKYENIKI